MTKGLFLQAILKFLAGVAVAGLLLFLLAYLLYAEVLRENAYLSRTIEIQADQKVIDTGLYGVSATPCTARPSCCSSPCRWCWVLSSPLPSSSRTP